MIARRSYFMAAVALLLVNFLPVHAAEQDTVQAIIQKLNLEMGKSEVVGHCEISASPENVAYAELTCKDEVETFTTDPAPPYVPPAQATTKSPSASETDVEKQSAQPEIQTRPLVKEVDTTDMSLAELDRRCEDAWEERNRRGLYPE